jgi:DNA-binding NarL/FixJ family response regulator
VEVLGDRELEVLQMIGEGMSMREIAAAMHISQKTVEAHREHIKQKLHLQSGTELLRYAVIRALGES